MARTTTFGVGPARCRPATGRAWVMAWTWLAAMCLALAIAPPAARGQGAADLLPGGQSVPRNTYTFAFGPYHAGSYRDAVKGFDSAGKSGIRTSLGPWVDAICYATMLGECFYRLGDYPRALQQHEAALQLALARRGWLKRIQFPPAIGPFPGVVAVPWGPGTRNARPGQFPDTIQSLQGTDTERAMQQGGVAVAPQLVPLNVVEVMRCLGVSLYRRRELLGPLAAEAPLTDQLVKEFSTHPVAQNHWASSLLGVCLGLAQSAAGDTDEAIATLQGSLVVMGQLDHPLTGIALLELGHLALVKNQPQLAQQSFLEATISGGLFAQVRPEIFSQADVIEEGFVAAASLQATAGQGMLAPLAPAAVWSLRQNWNRVASALYLAAAENAALAGMGKDANALLGQSRAAYGRNDMRNTLHGARFQHLSALIAFQSGQSPAGFDALKLGLVADRATSLRLFQLGLTESLYASKKFSPRVASQMLAVLLREPSDEDWIQDYHETLTMELSPLQPFLERWLEIAVANRDSESLLEISERLRRQKFYQAMPLGGRPLAFRWLLECPEAMLDKQARQQRQNLQQRYPKLDEASRRSRELSAALAQLPVNPDSPDQRRQYEQAASELRELAEKQESMLNEISLRPEPARPLFPPRKSREEILSDIKPGQAILVFVMTGRVQQALLLTSDKRVTAWPLKNTGSLRSTLVSMMRDIGNYDRDQVLPAERLTNEDWKQAAATLFQPLAEGLKPEVLAATKELVVVPDGFFWYLPFEMLQVPADGKTQSLIDAVPLRYSPTASLAFHDTRPRRPGGARTIVRGRLFSKETDSIIAAASEKLSQDGMPTTVLTRRLPASTNVVAPTWQQLIVLDDIELKDKDPLAWSPAQLDQGRPGSSLAEWLGLPFGGPDIVVLPGYHTLAEDGMRGRSNGDELLVATCGLLGTGCRTLLLSRWRTGGQMSMELVHEFLQGLAENPPDKAWQRSVLLARSAELDPTTEPRLKEVKAGEVPTANHPFFWAGYLLVSP